MRSSARGGVPFVAAGQHHTLAFSFNALCLLEDVTGRSVAEIGAALQGGQPPMTLLRAVLWAGLSDEAREKGIEIDLFTAGDILEAVGLTETGELIGKAMQLAFPDPKPGAEGKPNPRKPGGKRKAA